MGVLFDSLLLDAVVLLGTVIVTFYVYYTSTFEYWKKRNAPYLEPTVFFGNLKDQVLLRTSGAEGWQELYNQLKGHKFGGVFQSRRPALLLRDPELIRLFMAKDFVHFHDRGIPVDEKTNPLGAHLFNLGGTGWRQLRAKLTPTFTSGKMKMMFHLMSSCASELQNYLKDIAKQNQSVEVREVLAKFTTDVIGTCAFGIEFNSMKDEDSEFRKMGRRVFEPTARNVFRRTLFFISPALAKFVGQGIAPAEVNKFFLRVVKETVEYRETNNIKRNDFMQLLIQIKNEGKVDGDVDNESVPVGRQENGFKKEDTFELTDTRLAAQAFIFFVAGFETSSTTMSFCLYELALNPDIQERVREEVDTVLKEHGGELSYSAAQEMVYMDRVVNEALRKYPPVPNLFRECTKPYTIPGTSVEVEKGLRVMIPVYALQHDPQYYPEPEKFDPDRFTEENKQRRPNYTFLPFGEGPRICIGLRFGLMQTKVGLAAMLSKYEFRVSEKTSIPLKFDPRSFVLTAKEGIVLRVSERTR